LLHLLPGELGFEELGIADHRCHPADDGLVGAKEIVEGYNDQETETREET